MWTKISSYILMPLLFLGFSLNLYAANFPLEITQPQEGLSTHSRYYKAYPGIEYKVPVGVFGGLYPFNYELITAPSGMTIDRITGVITWSNPTTSHSVSVRVTDAENSTDTHSWTITVTTSGFIFLDVNAGSGGDGTLSRPFDSFEDVWGSDGSTSTYNDYFLYFRNGTYGLEGGQISGAGEQQGRFEWRPGSRHPHVWLEYPGETVIIDHDLAAGTSGEFINAAEADTDVFIHGIKFQDMRNHAFRGNNLRWVWFECTFYNGGPGQDGQNSSFIMFPGSGPASRPTYQFVKDCNFDTASGAWAFIKSYSTNKAVYEGNTYQNPSVDDEGLALKAYDRYVSVRRNTFKGDFGAGAICGNMNQMGYVDISFNKVIDADTTWTSWDRDGAVTIVASYLVGPMYIYRNTFNSNFVLHEGSTGDGPVYINNNIIVNENAAVDDPNGTGVTNRPSVVDNSCLVFGTGANANLYGTSRDNIIETNGELTPAYLSYVGTHGHIITDIRAPTNLRIVQQ